MLFVVQFVLRHLSGAAQYVRKHAQQQAAQPSQQGAKTTIRALEFAVRCHQHYPVFAIQPAPKPEVQQLKPHARNADQQTLVSCLKTINQLFNGRDVAPRIEGVFCEAIGGMACEHQLMVYFFAVANGLKSFLNAEGAWVCLSACRSFFILRPITKQTRT
jgi:hypothetical protein